MKALLAKPCSKCINYGAKACQSLKLNTKWNLAIKICPCMLPTTKAKNGITYLVNVCN